MTTSTRFRVYALASLCVVGLILGVRPALAAPSPTGVDPTTAANSGTTSDSQLLTIAGTGFDQPPEDNPAVVLRKTGQPDITGNVSSSLATQITATFNITNVAPGTWSVVVTNSSDGTSGTCNACFTITAPAPTTTSVTPSSRPQSFSGNLTITGTGFQPGVVASFTTTDITVNSTTRDSATQLTANVTIPLSAAAGARNVIATNTDAQAGTCACTFTVVAAPVPTSIAPSIAANTAALNTTITGSGFVAGVTVLLRRSGQSDIPGTSVVVNSSTSVSARFDITAAAPGTWSVRTTNTDGGVGSCSCFTVAGSEPTVTSASPVSRGQGASLQDITVTGTNFANGAAATFSGSGIAVTTTTFVSTTSLTVRLSVDGAAATGARDVTVTNTDAQAGTCTGCFTVNAKPTATSATPNNRGQGATSQNIVIAGTAFQSGATVEFSGTDITVNSVTPGSATSLTANITIGGSAATGARDITVTNPDAGTPAVCAGCFTVNAAPTVDSATPSSRGQGAATPDIVVAGTGFVTGANVSFSGTGITVHSTTFGSATSVTANITVAAGATTSARDVTVTNPDAGAGSRAGGFTVNAGPVTTSAAPDSRGQGAPAQDIVLTGSAYVSGATVAFSGTGITVNTVTFNSATQLTANITVAGGATASARDITVTNPDAGVSACTGCFTVNAMPTATGAVPASRGQGAATQNIVITGTGFIDGATAAFGTNITVHSTTFTSATSVTANITVDAAAATGPRDFTVTNPDGGTAATCASCFTVNAKPTATGATPSSRGQGSSAQDIVIAGTAFQPGATVAFSGTGITVNAVTFTSSTSLTANVTLTDGATTGARGITVTNPDAGTPAVCPECFTVNAKPTLAGASPSSRGQGAAAQDITLTGTGFSNADTGPTVSFSGSGVTVNLVTFNSATSLTARITIDAAAATGARNVTVTNADSGAATCAGCFTITAKPAVTSATPSGLGAGAVNRDVVVAGTGFASGASVVFGGTGITVNSTTFGSTTSLTANITISSSATAGARDVTVNNADAGAGSCTGCFTITGDPAPNAISPPQAINSGAVNTTINGVGFVSGATVSLQRAGQGDIAGTNVTFDSATQVRARFDITAAAPGTWTVRVTNPDSATGSCACFGVGASAPDVTGTTPSSRGQGATTQDITVNGTSFARGDTATFSGVGITVNGPTAFVSTTALTVNVTIDGGATAGARDVTVTHTDTQADTCTGCFTVNLKPTATSATPSSRGQGATSQDIVIAGTAFQSGATVAFSGTGINVNLVTFNATTSLTANVTIDGVAAAGARNITVTNPDAATPAVCAGCFTVNVSPTATSASPSSRGQGATAQSVTIAGTGFQTGTTAAFSGTGVTVNSTTVDSATSLRLNVTVDGAAATGARDVTVTNPDAGSTATCTGCFTVNAAPSATGATPSSRGQGAAAQSVEVTGSAFQDGATVGASGSGVTVTSVTFTSATTLTLSVSVDAAAATGARTLTVTNPDGGTSAACTDCFTVNAAPTATSVSPTSRGQGAASQNLTIAGTGFVTGATASFGDAGITVNSTTVDSATQITANVTLTGTATTGARTVTITNPDAGLTTCAACFTVNAAPTVTGAAPSSRSQGAGAEDLVLTGTGFVDGATVAVNSDGITMNSVTFTSATSITVNVTVSGTATLGAHTITVTNPDAGPGVCTTCFTVTVPGSATFTTSSVLTGTQVVAFDRAVSGVTTSNLVIRVTGTTTNLAASLVCRAADVSTVDCATGAVRSVLRRTTTNLVPGQRYTITVDPDGATPMTDDGGAEVAQSSVNFRASLVEQDSSVAAAPRWRRVSTSGAYGGSYAVAQVNGASATYAFSGTRIVWYPVFGPTQGLTDVYIDGVRRGTFDQYSASTRYRVGRAFNVANGAHTIKLLSRGTRSSRSAGTQTTVDAFAVTNGGVTALVTTPTLKYAWGYVIAPAASAGRYARDNLAGAGFLMRFRGTGFDWYTVTGPQMGLARIYVDGVLKATVDNYRSSLAYNVRRSVRGLSDGLHTVEIRVMGTKRTASGGTFVAFDRIVFV